MNSIGWSAKSNRGNASATVQGAPSIDPHEYNRNQLKGIHGMKEPVPTYGSSRLPITQENLSGTDIWGYKTAYAGNAPLLSPSTFNKTYLRGNPKYDMDEPAPEKNSNAHSIRSMQEHFEGKHFTDVPTLLKNLPIAQAEQLQSAAKTEATKAKWSQIVADLLQLEKSRVNNGMLTPEQIEMANEITQAVESGMVNLNLGKPFDPDDLELTYVEPDPLGKSPIYNDIEEEKSDDDLTRARKDAKKNIVDAFPTKPQLRERAERRFVQEMKQLLNSKKYKRLSSREQTKTQQQLIDFSGQGGEGTKRQSGR